MAILIRKSMAEPQWPYECQSPFHRSLIQIEKKRLLTCVVLLVKFRSQLSAMDDDGDFDEIWKSQSSEKEEVKSMAKEAA